MPIEIVISLISSITGGILVAIVNHLLTRRKFVAETKKLEAETEKVKVETARLLAEISKLNSSVESVNYKLAEAEEVLLYDGRKGIDPFDFEGEQGYIPGDEHKELGCGSLNVKGNVLVIERTNTQGRYIATLCRYMYDSREWRYIPKNEILAGERKLRVSCEAKVSRGSHTLVFTIKSQNDKVVWFDKKQIVIDQNDWVPMSFYFRVPNDDDCRLRIDDMAVSLTGSSVHIRNIVLAERAT